MFLHYGTESVWEAYPSIRVGDDWHHAFQICVPLFLFFAGYGLIKGLNIGEQSISISLNYTTIPINSIYHKINLERKDVLRSIDDALTHGIQ